MKLPYFQVLRHNVIKSNFLKRDVIYDLILPTQIDNCRTLPTIYMNDGQDLDQLKLVETLKTYYSNDGKPFIFVGIHTNEKRLFEYGTSYYPDYKNRGALATEYMKFVISELIPLVRKNTNSSHDAIENSFCGFSLGGLSAMDIVWENPHCFSKTGVFSGSFWWRDKSYEEGYDDDMDRIMHNKVRNSGHKNNLKFWFECGTADETADRNNNGVIDAIDDTLDIISELKNVGYEKTDIVYREIKDGQHNFETWSEVFPDFIEWAMKN